MRLSTTVIRRLPLPGFIKNPWLARRYDEEHVARLEAARRAGDRDRVEMIKYERQQDEIEQYEADAVEYSRSLLKLATSLRVPIPRTFKSNSELTDHWSQSQFTGDLFLTDAGVGEVRAEIRKELGWRRESRAHWIAWITAITGLVGALTGLMAIILS